MIDVVSYWYMFFVGIGMAAIATSAGIGGATFCILFLLLALRVFIQWRTELEFLLRLLRYSAQ